MKNFWHINFFTLLVFTVQQTSFSQDHNHDFDCIVYESPADTTALNSELRGSGDVSVEKNIRVVLHFPSKSDGSKNFTETTDYYGNTNPYTGYWFAEKMIEECNQHLNDNWVWNQQLSYESVPNNNINIQFQLGGVIFHKNDTLYNSKSLYTMDDYLESNNRDVAVHVFLYPEDSNSPTGATKGYRSDIAFADGVDDMYDGYLTNPYEEWHFHKQATTIIHEIAHTLGVDHVKRAPNTSAIYPNSGKCFDDHPRCIDDCEDTPTYLELIADIYTTPYDWCSDDGNGEWSNNIMDYSCLQRAWSSCQIQTAHDCIEVQKERTSCGYIANNLHVSDDIISKNKVYVAEEITLSGVIVNPHQALCLHNETFETTGELLVDNGILEIMAIVKCN